mmetsp:Transcript_1975/g.2560  ORF Transcript_1975/g.2560 Transcript_1975/m.2560 type:complete len:88 (+) Transcript_1975:363-626(+)
MLPMPSCGKKSYLLISSTPHINFCNLNSFSRSNTKHHVCICHHFCLMQEPTLDKVYKMTSGSSDAVVIDIFVAEFKKKNQLFPTLKF